MGGLLAFAGASRARATPYVAPPRPAVVSGVRVEMLLDGLAHPWAVAELPDGALIVTERLGRARVLRGGTSSEVSGLPTVLTGGQAGLLDIAIHPRFAANQWIYLTLASGDASANRTVLLRARLDGTRLVEARIVFTVSESKSGLQHFGSRLAWLPDGTLLMSIGDGGNPPVSLRGAPIREQAQNMASHLGKLLRLDEDGRPPADNPLVSAPGAAAEIWALGLRNVQGLAWDAVRGTVWCSDHGALGGDELNLVRGGANHGWPRVTHSREYSGREISSERRRNGVVDPALVWTETIAPSGLAVCSGRAFTSWRGDILAGGLVSGDIRRVTADAAGRVTGEHRIPVRARVRDVREAQDGALLVLTDEPRGRLLRLLPAD
ncbi:PQQ-dependent sugar dehydrogenase [Roseomonas fluvialis]|uniref:PQQ-dependent sugar dehydrogenase n=1 Tax=Roseomonas fluvialis TaxID=1750527 RepID=UPI001FCAB6B5|nr:PQQ-dependent sugar dehydrogenase [Roseomonas fluvialis]